ncbi:MAG TPA: DUF3105 domain-containing protein [Acidimicrobiia bacterium]|nr:DUF3105 domain-containing protein [Acidimicrobiia bacterium]
MSRGGAQRNPQQKQIDAEQRREEAKAAEKRRRFIIGTLITVALVGAVVFFATRPPPAALANVETFPDQGAQHIDPSGPAPDYNSIPATSGPHAPTPASCGVYREDVADVFTVHTLEHGAIVIRYEPSITAEDRAVLEDFARDAPSHVLVAPREGLEAPIALTAWTKRLLLDTADRDAISAFWDLYAQFGPERGVACSFQVDQSEEG